MLQVISALKGFAIEATDGRIGSVVEFLFDDAAWNVRWLLVDCGSWLKGRKVLIPPPAVSDAGLDYGRFEVKLTKAQVEGSPDWLEHQTVSQQAQNQLYDYYGWDPLWDAPYLGRGTNSIGSSLMTPPYPELRAQAAPRAEVAELQGGDHHLRSVVEVTGYTIHTSDGNIGHVEDFMLDNADWSLSYLIVDTSNWWLGKRVLIAPKAVTGIDWTVRQVQLDATREKVRASPPWDPLVAFDKAYETHLHNHYGWRE
jgi:sporulation protein YlmC with PRC-barrel domain